MVIETKPSEMYAVVIPEGGTHTLVYLFLFLCLIREKLEKAGWFGFRVFVILP